MNNKMPSSRSVLRRIAILVGVLVGVFIYAYGWRVTDINLAETQDQIRQDSVQRALRELLSPDVFDQERESSFVETNILLNCSGEAAALEQPTPEAGAPSVTISQECGSRGDLITVEGVNFLPGSDVFLRWIPPGGQSRPLVRTDVNVDGHFITVVTVPSLRAGQDEIHVIEVEESIPVGLPYFSDTTQVVIDKMVETLFLALMSTTLAVPIAAALSFLAARNLMRQISLPLGNVLVGFILLPVGWVLGVMVLAPLGLQAVAWGKDLLPGLVTLVVAFVVYGLVARYASSLDLAFNSVAYRVRGFVMSVLLLCVIVFTLGALGGISVWLAEQLHSGLLADLGNFVGTVGLLIELLIAAVAGLGGGLLVASVGMNLTKGLLRNLDPQPSHVLGAVLGVLGGAILMVFAALFAKQAAWFGLFPLFVAVLLYIQIILSLFGQMRTGDLRQKRELDNTERLVRMITAAVGAVIVFLVAYNFLDTGRAIVDGRVPSTITQNVLGFTIEVFLFRAAFIGAVLGGIGGALAGTHAMFPLGMTIYNTTRTILNALRSIEPLIMGIVFVIWVGIGPFAGMLALMLHSIAALGKLYSEQTESIDAGPLEAIQATGANRLQTIIYGVVPQIVPPYIAFTMYRWDINVRMSTIIGFVGGGGIGFLLQQQINLLRYRDAGVAVLAIAIVVSVLDYASASIRERIV